MIQAVGRNIGVVYPVENNVLDGTDYGPGGDYYTGTLTTNGTNPDAPVITGVVDNGDQDSFTASLTGMGTITIYYRVRFADSWISGGTRAGSGDVTVTGLTEGYWYEVMATATTDSIESVSSNIVTVRVATSKETIEKLVVSALTNDESIGSLVSNNIFPHVIPQGKTVPAVVYQVISEENSYNLDEINNMHETRIQVTSWADNYSEATLLHEYVENALDHYSATDGRVHIVFAWITGKGDMPEYDATDAKRRFGKYIDFTFYYKVN